MLKPYNTVHYSKIVEESGSDEQEGYVKIFSYNLWLSLNKITLTRSVRLYSDAFDVKNCFDYDDILKFIEECKDEGMTSFEFDHETDSDRDLEAAYIKGTRDHKVNKTKEQLLNEYKYYINDINKKNTDIWKHANQENLEYQNYLRLKDKYESK